MIRKTKLTNRKPAVKRSSLNERRRKVSSKPPQRRLGSLNEAKKMIGKSRKIPVPRQHEKFFNMSFSERERYLVKLHKKNKEKMDSMSDLFQALQYEHLQMGR